MQLLLLGVKISILRIKLIFIITLSILILGCHQKDYIKSNPFTGLWKLHILEARDSITGDWHEWLDGLQGYILYDAKNNMAVHLTPKGYQNTTLIFGGYADSASFEQLKYQSKSYVYFAKYEILDEEKIVVHHRISHSNPNLWNETVKRSYEFKGDTLVLTTLENKNSPLRVKWVKYN
jgi:hypothetical protein